MSEHIDLLVRELLELLREKGRVTLEELLKWGEEQGIRLALTLYMLVAEISEHEDVEVAPEEELVDPEYNIALPKWIAFKGSRPPTTETIQAPEEEAPGGERGEGRGGAGSLLVFLGSPGTGGEARAESKHVKPPEPRKPRERVRRRSVQSGSGLLAFLGGQEKHVEERKEEEEREEGGGAKEAVEEESNVDIDETLREISDLLEDESYLKALRYLSRYWSVGLYRFYRDMERSGVKNPQEILKTLYRRGLVEIAELEVINAKPKLRSLKDRLRKSPSLAEVFGG